MAAISRILELAKQPFTAEGIVSGVVWYVLPSAAGSLAFGLVNALADIQGLAAAGLWVGSILLSIACGLILFDRRRVKRRGGTARSSTRNLPSASVPATAAASHSALGSAGLFPGSGAFPGMPSHVLLGEQVKLILAVGSFGPAKSCSVRDPRGITTSTAAPVYAFVGLATTSAKYEVFYPRDFPDAGPLVPGKYHVSWFSAGSLDLEEPARYTFKV